MNKYEFRKHMRGFSAYQLKSAAKSGRDFTAYMPQEVADQMGLRRLIILIEKIADEKGKKHK